MTVIKRLSKRVNPNEIIRGENRADLEPPAECIDQITDTARRQGRERTTFWAGGDIFAQNDNHIPAEQPNRRVPDDRTETFPAETFVDNNFTLARTTVPKWKLKSCPFNGYVRPCLR